LVLPHLLLSLAVGVPVYHMPPVSAGEDIIIIMMEDGLLPGEPWAELIPETREEFWTFACHGMMVQRAAWSGYVILCPPGTGTLLLDVAMKLASAAVEPDTSILSTGLGLTPTSDCPSTVILFAPGGCDPPPPVLPLKRSAWLGGESDTTILVSDDLGSAFFWTGHPDDTDLSPAAWRGVGTEMVPVNEGSVRLAFSYGHGSVPSNLHYVTLQPHPMDTVFANTWRPAFAAADSLVAHLFPETDDDGHLLWIRGTGTGKPWRNASSPLPSPYSPCIVSPRSEPSGEYSMGVSFAGKLPGIREVALPGTVSSRETAPVIENILERHLILEFASMSERIPFFDVEIGEDGRGRVWILDDGGGGGRATTPDSRLLELLRKSLLVPPGTTLIKNASTRASFLEGRPLEPPGIPEVSMELLNLLRDE